MEGTRLGPYTIVSRLGEGGMGEVWLAEDTRLGRQVAVKVLPARFADSADRLSRFEQEARAAAALNHPHIAVLHDIGAVGEGEARVHYMVQEYLQGATLREELAAGPMPMRRALELGAQIAGALRAAHNAGIVHRDLKPENVFVTTEGHAKVLDFGLAKLNEPTGLSEPTGLPGSQSMSPTVIGTQAGEILGTVGYMSPEQATGRPVDARADLFSLGCMLYEMLTGRRTFPGDSAIDVLHAIVHDRPAGLGATGFGAPGADPEPADPELPPLLRWILAKCLAKNPADRYQTAADLAVDLHRAARPGALAMAEATTADAPMQSTTATTTRAWLPWLVAAAAVVVAALVLPNALDDSQRGVVRLSLPAMFSSGNSTRAHAISPDGSTLAYVDPETEALVLRQVDSFEAVPVFGGQNGHGPFFSPDGRRLAFFARGKLWTVDVAGGSPRQVVDVATTISTGVWAGDTIYFLQWATDTGILKVSPEGGVPEEVFRDPGDGFYAHSPRLLPGGVGLAVDSSRLGGQATRTWISFFDGRPMIQYEQGQITFLEDGQALFVAGGTLYRTLYDPASWAITGEPVAVATDVIDYVVSASGTLAYRAGVTDQTDRFARVQRNGTMLQHLDAGARYSRLSLSFDGALIATAGNDEPGLFLWDLARGTRRLLNPEEAINPKWLPDGRAVLFTVATEGSYLLREAPLDGTSPRTLHTWDAPAWATGVSPDGRLLAYYQIDPRTERDIWMLPLEDGGEPTAFLATPASERSAVFSPDGRWVAYMSDAAGREDVYVRPAPGLPGGEIVITAAGGREPMWSRDGREIHFRRGDGVWTVPVRTEPRFEVGEATELFTGRFAFEVGGRNQTYDVFPDGDLLMTYRLGDDDELRVVVNWFEELAAVAAR